jgi:hypothetical protein
MKNLRMTKPELTGGTVRGDYAPTAEQIDALAHRLMPEIKKFFADEQVQQEFAEWQERQSAAK